MHGIRLEPLHSNMHLTGGLVPAVLGYVANVTNERLVYLTFSQADIFDY
mgnify:CR=1 FL=1